MRSIALIHTVESVVVSFDQMLRREIGTDLTIHNLWNDHLADDPNGKGEFTADNKNRLPLGIKAQELAGADLIIITCSILTPTVETIRPFIRVPVIAVDDAMTKASVIYDERVLVVAIAGDTVHPIVSKIKREGETAGKKPSIDTYVCARTFQALRAMNMEKHDRVLMERTKEFTGYDRIVLAQTSIVHSGYETAVVTGCPMLISPRLCVEEIKQKLASLYWGWFFLGEMTMIARRRSKQNPSMPIRGR